MLNTKNSLPRGPTEPSSPNTKELYAIAEAAVVSYGNNICSIEYLVQPN